MRQEERLETIGRYNRRLSQYGHDPRTLGWLSGKQEVRFKALTEAGLEDGDSVLDAGCGFGDLYRFIRMTGKDVRYTGVDINPDLIRVAREAHPEAAFIVGDIDSEDVTGKYDWAFASGVFNFKLQDNEAFIAGSLRRMFGMVKKGVAVDFLSSYVDYMNEGAYHSSPEKIFSLARSMSGRVAIRHDYMPFEFCVYIYKDDTISKRNVFTQYEKTLEIFLDG